MWSKKWYFMIVFRVALITLTAFGLAYFIAKNQWNIGIYFGVLLAVETLFLIRFLNKTNTQIAYFFNAVENEDSTIHFPIDQDGLTISELNGSMNRLNYLLQEAKIEIETKEQLYQTILKQASIGILTINKKGHILSSNPMAGALLDYENLTHVEQLQRIDPSLYQLISPLNPLDHSLIKLTTEKEQKELTISMSSISIEGTPLFLVLIQNIQQELNQKESDSWTGLITVMTHEIMNAIAPITSLSSTLSSIFKKEGKPIPSDDLSSKNITNTIIGLDTIQDQGQSLMDFVQAYRSLTKVPIPSRKILKVKTLFEKIRILVSQEQGFDNIQFRIVVEPEDLECFADEQQIIQVLFKLTQNAIQSLKTQSGGRIILTATKTENGKIILTVNDNGAGIPLELQEQIFIPFFTTKKQGSGIGLSLSKQILRLHGGTLKVKSIPRESTAFSLIFN